MNPGSTSAYPLPVFRFWIDFDKDPLPGAQDQSPAGVVLCSGAFAECTGLEATMEAKVIPEGGRNYGTALRAGPVTFASVIFKRGMTATRDLYNWFELVNTGGFAYRLAATVTVFDVAGRGVLSWHLEKAIPVKFKAADLNARGTEIAVEELHVMHEGLRLLPEPVRTPRPPRNDS